MWFKCPNLENFSPQFSNISSKHCSVVLDCPVISLCILWEKGPARFLNIRGMPKWKKVYLAPFNSTMLHRTHGLGQFFRMEKRILTSFGNSQILDSFRNVCIIIRQHLNITHSGCVCALHTSVCSLTLHFFLLHCLLLSPWALLLLHLPGAWAILSLLSPDQTAQFSCYFLLECFPEQGFPHSQTRVKH
jgi:hypothetical protein